MRAAVLTWVLVGLFFVQEASSKCPDIKRRQQDTNCNYFCRNQAGDGWDEGFLLDGETCNVRHLLVELYVFNWNPGLSARIHHLVTKTVTLSLKLTRRCPINNFVLE
uniref:Putative basic tail protein n=1 Tax=Ixodes ricinus TaxID=34613 RepID=A0A0K8RDE6_IXORI